MERENRCTIQHTHAQSRTQMTLYLLAHVCVCGCASFEAHTQRFHFVSHLFQSENKTDIIHNQPQSTLFRSDVLRSICMCVPVECS